MLTAISGQADLALGNVVGSNNFNVLFILGVSALIAPLIVSRQLVRLDVPVMIGASLLLLIVAADGRIGAVEGGLLFAGAIVYTGVLIRLSRRASGDAAIAAEIAAEAVEGQSWITSVAFVVAGLVLLVVGSRWLVNGAVEIATTFGVSELVIGLTIVAVGTSLPEVATSVMASVRGERDIAVGNIVGSNIFNILSVLGVSAIVSGSGIAVATSAIEFDIPVMLVVAFACLPIFLTGHLIARWEGGVFLGYYFAYTTYLVFRAVDHPALAAFRTTMLYFALPLTVFTLLMVSIRSIRDTRTR